MGGQEDTLRIIDIGQSKEDIEMLIAALGPLKEEIKSFSGIAIGSKNTNGAADFKAQAAHIADALGKIKVLESELDALRATNANKQKARTDEEIRASVQSRNELKNRTDAIKAEGDAYKQLSLAYNRAAAEAKNLQAVALASGLAKDKEAADKASIAANGYAIALKKIDTGVGDNRRHVGDYIGALSTLRGELTNITQKMEQMAQAGQQDTETYAQMAEQSELLNTIISQQANGFSSVTMEIRNGERALQSMRAASMEGTEAFNQMRIAVSGAAREQKEFQRQQHLLESEAPLLRSLTLAAKGLAGAYAIGAGSAALLADGNEKVQKEINKLVAIMTIMQGIQEAWELIQEAGAISLIARTTEMGVLSAATGVYTFVTEGATAATIGLNAALVASGIGLAVIALIGFIEAVKTASHSVEEDWEEQEKLNQSVKEYWSALVKANEEVERQTNIGIEIEKQKLKIQEINARSIVDETKLGTKRHEIAMQERAAAVDNLKDLGYTYEGVGRLQDKYGLLVDKITSLQKLNAELPADLDRYDSRLKEMTEKRIKEMQSEADLMKVLVDRGQHYVDIIDAADRAEQDLTAEDEKFAHELYERKIKALTEINNLIRGQSADYLALQSTNSGNSDYQQEAALKAEQLIRQQIITSNRDQELRNEKLTKDERTLIIEKADEEIYKLNVEFITREAQLKYNARLDDVNEENKSQEDIIANLQKFYDQKSAIIKRSADEDRNSINEDRDLALARLDEKHVKNNPSGRSVDELQKYNDEKRRITDEALTYTLEANLKEIQSNKALAESRNQILPKEKRIDLTKFHADIAKTEFDIEQAKNKAIIASAEEVAARKKKLQAEEINLGKEVQTAVVAFAKAGLENSLNAIQKQIDANDKLKETESANIEASSLSATQKAAEQIELTAKTTAHNEALQRSQRNAKIKEAEIDRAVAVLNVGENTAVAITKAIAEFPLTAGEPWAAIAAGVGAAQIAAILAKPIPKYHAGTDYSPEGLAEVHPGEMRIDPSGNISMTPDRPSLTFLQRGTQIIPAHEVNAMRMQGVLSYGTIDNQVEKKLDHLTETLERTSRETVNAFRKQKAPQTHIHVDSGFLTHITNSCS